MSWWLRPSLLGAFLLASSIVHAQGGPRPPDSRGSAVRAGQQGEGSRSYWLFEPAEPEDGPAPVVVFLHGWQAVNPAIYGAWIEHLVRDGKIVVFPKYQAEWSTDPARFLPNAQGAIADALNVLRFGPGHVRPDLSRFALIGHSAGGNLAAQIAATAAEMGLPTPRAVVAVTPGEVLPSREPSLATIPAETLLAVAVVEFDRVVGDHRGRAIFAESTSIPRERKLYVFFHSDRHGEPPIVADHMAPTGRLAAFDSFEGMVRSYQLERAGVDALDVAGFWRIADVTLAAAFAGRTLAEATADGALWRTMGRWSDGRPVRPPAVGHDLDAMPRAFLKNGIRLVDWSTFDPVSLPRIAATSAGRP